MPSENTIVTVAVSASLAGSLTLTFLTPRAYRTPVTIAALFAIGAFVSVCSAYNDAAGKSLREGRPVPIDRTDLTISLTVFAVASVFLGTVMSLCATQIKVMNTPAWQQYSQALRELRRNTPLGGGFAAVRQYWHNVGELRAILAAATAHV